MSLYKASVTYSEESINAFAKAQFGIFQRKTKITLLAAATLLLLLGAFEVGGQAISILLLFAGCLLIVNVGNIPRRTAKAMMARTAGITISSVPRAWATCWLSRALLRMNPAASVNCLPPDQAANGAERVRRSARTFPC